VKVGQRRLRGRSTIAATGAARRGVGKVIMPVRALALDRDEQRERLDELGIGDDRLNRRGVLRQGGERTTSTAIRI
jgi:hypothetical protein